MHIFDHKYVEALNFQRAGFDSRSAKTSVGTLETLALCRV